MYVGKDDKLINHLYVVAQCLILQATIECVSNCFRAYKLFKVERQFCNIVNKYGYSGNSSVYIFLLLDIYKLVIFYLDYSLSHTFSSQIFLWFETCSCLFQCLARVCLVVLVLVNFALFSDKSLTFFSPYFFFMIDRCKSLYLEEMLFNLHTLTLYQ